MDLVAVQDSYQRGSRMARIWMSGFYDIVFYMIIAYFTLHGKKQSLCQFHVI